ncbi:MAG: type III-B CRISPR module-associated protein Cmr5 [Methylothermaceae bacterium]|nr:type III-B CRISPR module-associated protein Cmr5 [Methylothermaceae bacterium]
MSMILDQQRAAYAWKKTEDAQGFIGDYNNVAKSTASLIMSSGLMQTLAFLKSKDSDEHKALLSHLLKWLDIRYLTQKEDGPPPAFEVVMTGLYRVPSSKYMQLTNETMALLRWIRQFADARKAMEKGS